MCDIQHQSKIIKYAKKIEEYDSKPKEKNCLIDTDWEMTEMMEVGNKDITTTIVNMLHMFNKVEKNIIMVKRK